MSYKQSDFVNRAIARAIKTKDNKLTTTPTPETKEAKPKKEEAKEEENLFTNPYDEFLKTWEQGDVLPLIPPGKTLHLCKFGNPLHIDTNYFDLQNEYKVKKSKVAFKHPDLKLDSKSLGPKLRDEVDTLLARSMMGKFGLKPWVDDKNKLRCPEGTPAANQFTDQRMSNCFIISPATAAGSASRIARRAGSSMANAAQVGQRTQAGFDSARDMNNLTQQDFLDLGYDEVSSRMAVGGRIVGAMAGSVGSRYDPRTGSRVPSEPFLLGYKEKNQRGERATMLALATHRMIANGDIQLPPSIRFPNGRAIGDITKRENFTEVMQEVFENITKEEIEHYFDNSIPAGLPWEQRRRAKRGVRSFWEGMITEAIANPDHAKWVTRFSTDYNMNNAFEMTLQPFAPSIDDNGRVVSATGSKLVAGRNAADGGVHMIMKINPRLLFSSSLNKRNADERSAGTWDSVEGDMHYTATHEFGHLAHFSSAMQAMGFDVNNLTRYQNTPTAFTPSSVTGSGAQWRPKYENGGWQIDFTKMHNPMNSQSLELVRQAAKNLQTRQYMGGRGHFNSIDLQKDLNEFYDAFAEAVNNNITDTKEDLEIMRQFAGGSYASSNPIETRAEYYAARRLFGETGQQIRALPANGRTWRGSPLGAGPVNPFRKNANYVEEFAQAITSSGNQPRKIRTPTMGQQSKTPQQVVQQMDQIGRQTFGVRPQTWNLTGAMSVGDSAPRVSLHAEQVRRAVENNERRPRRKLKPKQQWQPLTNNRITSGITGAMTMEDKPYYPREPSYGAFIGEAQKVFGGASTWEEFKKIYDDKEVVFFDYETTGIEHDADGRTIDKGSPTQIGAVRMKGDKVLDRLNVFMKPDRPLGEWSRDNLKDKDGNPLTDKWLDTQASMLEAHQMLADFAGENAIFGVQYAPFDKDVLDATLEKLGMQWRPSGYLDTKDIAEHTLPRWTPENPEGPSKLVKEKVLDDGTVIPEHRKASNGLADITAYLGVDLGSKHHTADADSEAAGKVMSGIINKAIEKNLPNTVLDMKSQNDRIAQAKDDFEKAVADFEQHIIQKNSDISGAMAASTKIASTRASNRRTREIKGLINKDGGNFGGDTSARYVNDIKPSDTMLGPTLISETKAARFQERENIITALKSTVPTFISSNEGPIAAAAPPGQPPPDDPNDPNKNPLLGAGWLKHKTDVMNGLNGLSPEFHKYLNETSPEQLNKDLKSSILDFHEGLDGQPRVNLPGRLLKDVLENGFKNSHQRNEIAGINNILSKYEADIGVHPDTPPELRPASGFVLHRDELQREQNDVTKFLDNRMKEDPDRYFPNLVDYPHSKRTRGNDWNFGNAEIILNHGVSDRTAYGNGDLFNNHIEPTGMNSNDSEVIARAHIDAAFKTDNRVENIIEHLYNNFKGDHDAYRKEKYATSPGRSWEPREASIAGGFNADDIDEIKIPFDSIPKNFIDGHPGSPGTNSAMGKDSYIKDSEFFLNGIKENIISDDAMSKINPTEEERKIIRDILTSSPKDFVIPDSVQKGMNRYGADEFDLKQEVEKYLKMMSAESMKKNMQEKGIKLSVTNKFGLDVFNPKSFNKDIAKNKSSQEALRDKIEKMMADLIKEMRNAIESNKAPGKE